MSQGERCDPVRWRKSVRSNSTNSCVEVGAVWRKSTRSNSTGACIEVAPSWGESTHRNSAASPVGVAGLRASVAVRDSKNPHGQRLAFTADQWTAFAAHVKQGDLDT